MNYTHFSHYGHAMCTHCRTEFDLNYGMPTVLERLANNDTLIYMMCPECHAAYQSASKASRQSMANQCFINFKLKGNHSDGSFYPWAITTMLTMALNDFDPVAAIENGHGLAYEAYLATLSGTHEYCVVLDGIFLGAAKPKTSGAA